MCFCLFFQPKLGYQNNLKVLYSQKNTPGSTRKTGRYIASMSDRILDAPDIRNDYCKKPRLLSKILLCGGRVETHNAFGHYWRCSKMKLYLTELWLS